jgi:hypothetical protein
MSVSWARVDLFVRLLGKNARYPFPGKSPLYYDCCLHVKGLPYRTMSVPGARLALLCLSPTYNVYRYVHVYYSWMSILTNVSLCGAEWRGLYRSSSLQERTSSAGGLAPLPPSARYYRPFLPRICTCRTGHFSPAIPKCRTDHFSLVNI